MITDYWVTAKPRFGWETHVWIHCYGMVGEEKRKKKEERRISEFSYQKDEKKKKDDWKEKTEKEVESIMWRL